MTRSVLQISDCHLVAAGERLLGVDTQASLEAVLQIALAEGTPDAVLATGDIAHTATAAVYERFADTVHRFCELPLLCLPGNHDVLGEMQSAGLPMAALERGDWIIAPLDSHQDDVPEAQITAADRRAVTEVIAASTASCPG